jgi:cytochrome c oxidase assembly protein subunit 15
MEIASNMIPAEKRRSRRLVAWWLIGVAALIFLMVIVGGLTRLTESGLSITEWKPVMGTLPPLSEEHWQEEFQKYKQIPQYELVNKGMSLTEFKNIYWWEWAHRFLGRFIGLAFLVPFLVLLGRGHVERSLAPRLALLFVLGGLQGVLGWWMVKSGLTHRVDVSQYRLTAHFGLAAIIYALLVWTALELLRAQKPLPALGTPLHRASLWLLGLVFLQMLFGGLVAGLKAGFSYNSWPLMDGAFIPTGLFAHAPWWINFFENVVTVQFQHRMLAYLIFLLVVWHWLTLRHTVAERTAFWLVVGVFAQAALGIWTLLAVVPISLGAAHQAGAMIVFTLALYHAHRLNAS